MRNSRLGQFTRRPLRARERSLALAADARRRLSAPPRRALAEQRGRLWLNGRELGDLDARLTHLRGSYD